MLSRQSCLQNTRCISISFIYYLIYVETLEKRRRIVWQVWPAHHTYDGLDLGVGVWNLTVLVLGAYRGALVASTVFFEIIDDNEPVTRDEMLDAAVHLQATHPMRRCQKLDCSAFNTGRTDMCQASGQAAGQDFCRRYRSACADAPRHGWALDRPVPMHLGMAGPSIGLCRCT